MPSSRKSSAVSTRAAPTHAAPDRDALTGSADRAPYNLGSETGRDPQAGPDSGQPANSPLAIQSASASEIAREPSEVRHRDELDRLREADRYPRPGGWQLSPRMVQKFILGDGHLGISTKYVGDPATIQLAIASLASDRGLLLTGLPGTAKSWLSEHLAAAISGDSQLIVQGTAGLTEDQVRYTWNYALLLAEGPTERALAPAPILEGMRKGLLVRFEEVTRCAPEVQDSLISILSEKAVAIPELGRVEPARRGFNVIATANTRDRGVNEMSAALRRRFSFVVLPSLDDLQAETDLVRRRVDEMLQDYRVQAELPEDAVATLTRVFAELRRGQTLEGNARLRSPEGPMSTAEAISSLFSACLMAAHFGHGQVTGHDLLRGLSGAVVQEGDRTVLDEYLQTVARGRAGRYWNEMVEAASLGEDRG